MKRIFVTLILAAIALGLHTPDNNMIEDRVLLLLDPDIETSLKTADGILQIGYAHVDDLLRQYGAKKGRYIVPLRMMSRANQEKIWDFRNCIVVDFRSIDEEAVSEEARQLPGVLEAAPDYLERDMVTTPNDEYYGNQWYIRRVNADDCWDFTTGSSEILMSNFESVDWKHPDIAPLIWNNLAEDADGDGRTLVFSPMEDEWVFDPGDINGIDEDSNGYADDLIGWDFIAFEEGDLEPEEMHDLEDYYDEDMDPMDDVGAIGHGTHVAGTMISSSNNGIGTAGINWQGRLAVLRGGYHYYDSHTGLTGTHPTSPSIGAYLYARLMEFDVVNMSYGGYNYNGMTSTAIRGLWDNNTLVVAAGGNDSVSDLHYPAAYIGVMGVAATNEDDYHTDFTCFGNRIDISAPGEGIYAPVPRYDEGSLRSRPYEAKDGTSMASPVVAGCGALLWSFYPDSSNRFIYNRLVDSAEPMEGDPVWAAGSLGAGRVDVYRAAFQLIYPHLEVDTIYWYASPTDPDGIIGVGDTGFIVIEYTSDSEWIDPGTVTLDLTALYPEGYEGSIDYLNTPLPIGHYVAGDNIDNIALPIRFMPNSGLDDGRDIEFNVRLESETGYYIDRQVTIPIDYPSLLLYDRDGGTGEHQWIEDDLNRGQVPFYRYDADSLGPIDPEFLQSQFRTVVFINGQNDADPITAEEAGIFADFLALGGERDMLLAGQYLADDPDITTLLADYFHTEHVSDVIDSRFWGINTVGVPGDTVTNDLSINIATGSDFMGPQYSIGQCRSTGGAYNVLLYDGHDDVFCGTRYEDANIKTFFCEFSLAGVSGNNPTGESRYQFLYRILVWFGHPFMGVAESPAQIPDQLSITAHPNPFNAACQINVPDGFTAAIYDIHARHVQALPTGSSIWNADGQPSGVYLVKAQKGDVVVEKRVVLVK